ncbi:MAG: glycosyltransferase family 4 protein [Candidatus Krumholzibacteriota bacterium]|nr:glycosyltransferase family 4 protein [Candidatus Krumholzibacteriota bacterium]
MKKLFFINYVLHRPRLPNVSGRYELLSDSYHGDMVAVCPSGSTDAMPGNFVFHNISSTRIKIIDHIIFIFSVLWHGLRSQRRKKIDIIVAYDPLLCGFCGYILKRMTGARLVVEVNGDIIKAGFLGELGILRKFKNRLVSGLTVFILDRADKIKYLNSEIAAAYSSMTKNGDYETFINFVPTYEFQKGPTRFDKVVLFVGFPFYLKGVDILIDAFKMISHRHSDFALKIVGYCPDPQDYYEMIGDNANIIIEKPVFYDEIISEFKNCYCFVLPSRSEGMGRVLIEAMASGKPVIGSKVGGIPFLIRDGENGFLFEKGNASDLAAKLEILLGDESIAKEMGERARQYVEGNLSSEIYIARFKKFLDSLL